MGRQIGGRGGKHSQLGGHRPDRLPGRAVGVALEPVRRAGARRCARSCAGNGPGVHRLLRHCRGGGAEPTAHRHPWWRCRSASLSVLYVANGIEALDQHACIFDTNRRGGWLACRGHSRPSIYGALHSRLSDECFYRSNAASRRWQACASATRHHNPEHGPVGCGKGAFDARSHERALPPCAGKAPSTAGPSECPSVGRRRQARMQCRCFDITFTLRLIVRGSLWKSARKPVSSGC